MIGIDLDHKNDRVIHHIQCGICGRPATPDDSDKIHYLDNGKKQTPVCPRCLEKWIMQEGFWKQEVDRGVLNRPGRKN